MDYDTLVGAKDVDGSIRNWVNWARAPAGILLAEAEAWVYSRLRTREMKTLVTGTIDEDAIDIDLPERFVGIISFRRTGDNAGKIAELNIAHFENRLSFESDGITLLKGTPCECVPDGTKIRLNARADQDYPYRLWFWRRAQALSVLSQTNFLTERYPYLLTAACLYRANAHRKDAKEREHWLQMAVGHIEEANAEADLEKTAAEYAFYWNEDDA